MPSQKEKKLAEIAAIMQQLQDQLTQAKEQYEALEKEDQREVGMAEGLAALTRTWMKDGLIANPSELRNGRLEELLNLAIERKFLPTQEQPQPAEEELPEEPTEEPPVEVAKELEGEPAKVSSEEPYNYESLTAAFTPSEEETVDESTPSAPIMKATEESKNFSPKPPAPPTAPASSAAKENKLSALEKLTQGFR